jgi:RNA polymerase-binding transcription factor DksA
MIEGMLLQTVESLEDSFADTGGQIWERLQAEKEGISQDILLSSSLQPERPEADRLTPEAEWPQEIEWRQREILEERLRDLNDAQDKLIDGGYGICGDCGLQIAARRLAADPAASRCLACQELSEGELLSTTL